ncbi:uncharacterized protein LOC117110581 [Anneissia japonica]|uniref:uncharacterized protein LOC117110581 n=1 Tax=Anneissia japonica TaxID=1529436 RepID=UPI0014258DBA|nr:uncharacterized protein LOC117110581 [Anneissia japonica]
MDKTKQMSPMSNSNNDTLDSFLSPGTIIQLLRSPNANRLTRAAMTSMFTTSELATGLVTGQRLKKEDKYRPVLDQKKINAIVEFVCKAHPDVTAAAVRSKMSQKCKDTRHSMKRIEKTTS